MAPKRKASAGVGQAIKRVQSTGSRNKSREQQQQQAIHTTLTAEQATIDRIMQQLVLQITPVITAQVEKTLGHFLGILQGITQGHRPAISSLEQEQLPMATTSALTDHIVQQSVGGSIAQATSALTGLSGLNGNTGVLSPKEQIKNEFQSPASISNADVADSESLPETSAGCEALEGCFFGSTFPGSSPSSSVTSSQCPIHNVQSPDDMKPAVITETPPIILSAKAIIFKKIQLGTTPEPTVLFKEAPVPGTASIGQTKIHLLMSEKLYARLESEAALRQNPPNQEEVISAKSSQVISTPFPTPDPSHCKLMSSSASPLWCRESFSNPDYIESLERKVRESAAENQSLKEENEALKRKLDALQDYYLVPGVSYETTRPRMSLVMPAAALNETMSCPGSVCMTQTDCEVMNTQLIHDHKSTIPKRASEKNGTFFSHDHTYHRRK